MSQTEKKHFVENLRTFLPTAAPGADPACAIAQAALESNWGMSKLATEGQNIFSMTLGSEAVKALRGQIPMDTVPTWSSLGHSMISFNTTEYSALTPEEITYWEVPNDVQEKTLEAPGRTKLIVLRYFRRYANWSESATDWFHHLQTLPVYQPSLQCLLAGDWMGFVKNISPIYATDPAYEESLLRTLHEINVLPS